MPESFHPWIAVAVTVMVFLGMQLRRGIQADLLFLAALVLVTVTGVISTEQALAGFANPAIFTISGLLVVAAGLRSTGVLDIFGHRLLGKCDSEKSALRRISVALISTSAFLLNAGQVAMMMPLVIDWCRRRRISPSRLLIPLSYLAILGGVCTLIGTSTTLVVNGMLKAEYEVRKQAAAAATEGAAGVDDAAMARQAAFVRGLRPMGLFEIGYVGFPIAMVGVVYLIHVGLHLLPNRTDMIEKLDEQRREYLVEMLVRDDCRLIGKTIEDAGLRHLPGLFLIEIDRDGDIITPVTPEDVLRAGDRLIFTGVVSTIVDLQKIAGLVPAADRTYEFHPHAQQQRKLTEVVLSRTSPLIGTTVRKANFRQRYNAAVVAVHRAGERLTTKIGDIRLEAGDTLLLQTRSHFVSAYRNSGDFYLVSSVEGAESRRHDRALVAAGLVLVLILWMSATGWLGNSVGENLGPLAALTSPAIAAIAVAVLLVVTRCLPVAEARAAIDLQVIITIAAALGLGRALTDSGAAQSIAGLILAAVGNNPYLLLVVIYLLAMIFTEVITNVAVAAMLFPLAVALAATGGFCPRPFIMAISLAASLSFVTPVGYHTNLMVMSPGGYRARDYLIVGLPLSLITAATALLLIPLVWPFELL